MYKLIETTTESTTAASTSRSISNYADFRLYDFFDKEVKGLKKKFALHAFNYLGIVADDFLIGIAAVDLGYMQNVFAYLYHYRNGKIFEYSSMSPGWGPLKFPVNPDEYVIRFKKKGASLFVAKSHEGKELSHRRGLRRKANRTGDLSVFDKREQAPACAQPVHPHALDVYRKMLSDHAEKPHHRTRRIAAAVRHKRTPLLYD